MILNVDGAGTTHVARETVTYAVLGGKQEMAFNIMFALGESTSPPNKSLCVLAFLCAWDHAASCAMHLESMRQAVCPLRGRYHRICVWEPCPARSAGHLRRQCQDHNVQGSQFWLQHPAGFIFCGCHSRCAWLRTTLPFCITSLFATTPKILRTYST